MNKLTRLAMFAFIVGFYVGCSPVKFSLDGSKCQDSGCIVENGKYSFSYSATAGRGKVDILIVNDNSASMSFEQARLAPRFNNFIDELDGQGVDYRIAMTTTDVSGSRGGQLISFGSAGSYLTNAMSNRKALFNAAIQRPETLACEKFIANWIRNNGGNLASIETSAYSQAYAQNCPSGDERGIYAANLVVNNNPSSFIRNDAHLAIIFLSDEDVRSGLYGNGMSLESLDQPGSLTTNVKSRLGEDKYKSLSIHAIIVKDGDSSCLAQQNSQTLDGYSPTTGLVTGSYGRVYQTFATAGWGVAANICSEDYTSQLGQIRSKISDKLKDIVLQCSNPEELIVTLSGSPVSYTVDGKTLKFNQYLSPGTSVHLSYKCTSL